MRASYQGRLAVSLVAFSLLGVLVSAVFPAQDTRPQIAIACNHELFLPGERMAFDVTITLPEPVQDMQVKGFYPTPETEPGLTQTGPLSYCYEATAALPEGARKLRVTVYGRKKPNQPITPMAHEDKLVHVQAVTPDLTDKRITLTQIEDSPDPFSAAVKGENTFRASYNVQLANAEGPRLRQLITIRNARNEIVREIETVVELQAGATSIEVLGHWDGKNGAGQMLPDSLYAYEASGILYSHKVTAGNVVEQILGITSAKTGEITLDNTPPTMSATQEPPPTGGWNKTDVVVTFSAQDNLSGVAEVTQPVTVSEQGKDIEVNGKAVDKAGNEATLVYKVSIDKTPPIITASQEPAPTGAWNKTDVIVTFQAEDELSGVAEVTPPVTVTEEGDDMEVPGSATDLAGNTGYAMHVVSIDKTAPQITGLTPADGSEVATATPEIAATLTDVLSKVDPDSIELKLDGVVVAHSYDPDTGGVSYTPAEALADGQHTVSVKCEDMADNPAEASSHFMVSTTPPPPQDTMPPETIVIQTPQPNEAGWNNTDVTLEFEAMDDLSGVAATHVLVDGEASGAPAHLTDEGGHNVEYWSVDKAGNIEQHHALAVKIDKTPPVTEALVQQEAGYGGYYWDRVDVAVGATDNLSGVVEMHIVVDGEEAGSPMTLTAEGEHVISYWSLDNAGNMEPEHELRVWLLKDDGDLDGDGDPNGFEREIGTQVDDAGSGLAHGDDARVTVEYSEQHGSEGYVGRWITVSSAGGSGQRPAAEGQEFIAVPQPFMTDQHSILADYAVWLEGEVLGGLTAPMDNPWGEYVTLDLSGLGDPRWQTGYAIVTQELQEDGTYKLVVKEYDGYAWAYLGPWGCRQAVNVDRRLPVIAMGETPAIGTVRGWTWDGREVTLQLGKTEHEIYHYGVALYPIRTDMDMTIGGCVTFGESKSQEAPTCGLDPEAGTVVGVTCALPAEPQGFQGLNADRTVSLSWPDGMFECLNPQEGQDAHTRVGKGSFGW